MTRVREWGGIKAIIFTVAAVLCLAVPAGATTITLNLSGNLDLSSTGGSASNPFSAFFTWDPATPPVQPILPGDTDATYDIQAYRLIINGIDRTSAVPGNAGIIIVNNEPLMPGGPNVDAVIFAADVTGLLPLLTPSNPPNPPSSLLFVAAISGPNTVWNTLALPGNTSFLTSMPNRFSLISEEVPGGGDSNDIDRGQGSLTVAVPVPEPATLTLTALSVGGMLVRRARRARGARRRG